MQSSAFLLVFNAIKFLILLPPGWLSEVDCGLLFHNGDVLFIQVKVTTASKVHAIVKNCLFLHSDLLDLLKVVGTFV